MLKHILKQFKTVKSAAKPVYLKIVLYKPLIRKIGVANEIEIITA